MLTIEGAKQMMIDQAFDLSAATHSDRGAITTGAATCTYRELDARVSGLSRKTSKTVGFGVAISLGFY